MPAIILAAVLAATPAGPSASTACVNALVRPTADDGSVHGRKLADMPPAYLMHAVLREAGGCDLAEVRFAPGVWRNLQLGAAPTSTMPAGKAPSPPPR